MKKLQSVPMTLFLLTFAVLVCLSCGSGGRGKRGPITIGLIAPLSGEVADLGREILASANLAVKKANSTQSELQFRLVARDDQMSAAAGATAAKSLLDQENAVSIVGAGISAVVRGEVEAMQGKQIPLITPTATASDLATDLDYFFRVIPPNRAQGEALASFALGKLGAKQAVLLFQHDDYALDLKKAFEEVFTKAGGKITLSIGFEGDETDFRPHLERAKTGHADVIVCLAQHVPVARVLVRARELGIEQPIISGETAYTDKLLAAAGQVAKGFYVTGAAIDLENASGPLLDFVTEFEKSTGKKPGIYGCYTYDSIGLIVYAITHTGDRGVGLLKGLHAIKAYDGVTGIISFDPLGNTKKVYKMYTVENGAFVPVQ